MQNDQFLFSKYAPRDCVYFQSHLLTLVPSAHSGLHVSVAPSSSFRRGRASISHTTIFPIVPPIHPSAFLFSRHWTDLRPEGSKRDRGREDRSKLEGGRKHERKELKRERGRAQAGEGWAGDRNRVKQWSGCSCSRLGRGRRSAETWREPERMGGNERGSPWPQGALSSLSYSHSISLSTSIAHTQTVIFLTNRKDDSKQTMKLQIYI